MGRNERKEKKMKREKRVKQQQQQQLLDKDIAKEYAQYILSINTLE